jgi:hypothetical protein
MLASRIIFSYQMIIVYCINLPGYQILFTAYAFVSQSQSYLDTRLHHADIPIDIYAFHCSTNNSHILYTIPLLKIKSQF